jgi:hypothetical protein
MRVVSTVGSWGRSSRVYRLYSGLEPGERIPPEVRGDILGSMREQSTGYVKLKKKIYLCKIWSFYSQGALVASYC